jgi:hypothetical protein
MPTLKWKKDCPKPNENSGLNETSGLEDPKCLVLSENVWDATVEQMYNQLGDKTFVLVMIFTIAWSNWHLDLDDREVEKKDEETPKETKEVKIESHPEETKDEDKEETKEDDLGVFSPSINNEGGDSEEDELAKFIVKKPLPKR